MFPPPRKVSSVQAPSPVMAPMPPAAFAYPTAIQTTTQTNMTAQQTPYSPAITPSPPPTAPSEPLPHSMHQYSSQYLYVPEYSGHQAVHAAPVHHASVISSTRHSHQTHPTQPTPPVQAASVSRSQVASVHEQLASASADITLRYSSPTPSPTPSQCDPREFAALSAPAVVDDELTVDDSRQQSDTEYDDDLPPSSLADPSDLLARLCSTEKIKADNLDFWKKCMDGMEWAFYETQSTEVQSLISAYCKNFVTNAGRSRNLHALLLVVCRHLENYSQTVHMVISNDAGLSRADYLTVPTPGQAASGHHSQSNAHSTQGSLLANLSKDHPWITQLIYFLRLVLQYILTNLSYDDILLFFQHLAIPDVASKPGTPKTPRHGYGGVVGEGDSWMNNGDDLSALPPLKNHTINLNPNSRRGSLNSQVDILTRFVCAIVNMLEVLGDAPLNAQISHGKGMSTGASVGLGGKSNSNGGGGGGVGTSSSTTAPTKSHQPLIDLHLELLNTFFVMLSTQMYLPLSTEYEQVFLDRLLYCCKPPMLNSSQGFITSLLCNFTEILPQDWEVTLKRKYEDSQKKVTFFTKLTTTLTNMLYFPVWAVRYLFTIPPNHPLIDRSTLLIELLVYQNNDNEFRNGIRNLKNADRIRLLPDIDERLIHASRGTIPGDNEFDEESGGPSTMTLLEMFEFGRISFDKLYYAICSTLLSEHINLLLYSLIHENAAFRLYLLLYHKHDLDYLLMPMLEILYREVDISKHHVYMIINIWILLTQHQGFDDIIKKIRVKDVPFFKEMVLKDLTLTQVMQIVLLRTLQLNLRTKLKEPHIFNNCLAAFCNLTITAMVGPPVIPIGSPWNTPPTSPHDPNTPASPVASPAVVSILSGPMTLHPQVSFRLTRVLCILSRKFLKLQNLHEIQILEHNLRIERMTSEEREELTEEEEREELELEEVAEELGTCMEFIQLLLEVVNHSIVHAIPPAQTNNNGTSASSSSSSSSSSPPTSSLASNPHLLYNLIHSQEYFLQLLPYSHLFESNLISNVTNVLTFYGSARGVNIPSGDAGKFATAGGGQTGKRNTRSEKEVEASVQALIKAIQTTPMHHHIHGGYNTPSTTTGGVLHQPGTPDFDPTALIERGPFTYHEQENSQDFFVPYIWSALAQSMHIVPKMYVNGDSIGSTGNTNAASSSSPSMGDVNADEIFMQELEHDHDDIQQQHQQQQHQLYHDTDDDDDGLPSPYIKPETDLQQDMTRLNIAIK